MAQNFLGSGWSFPPRLDARGQIALAHGEGDIEEAIRIVLSTRKGERPFRPEFGSELHELTFAPSNAATAGLARRFVMEALARWEPRIEVQEVVARFGQDPGALFLDVRYVVSATNSERNLVFPFYTIPGEG